MRARAQGTSCDVFGQIGMFLRIFLLIFQLLSTFFLDITLDDNRDCRNDDEEIENQRYKALGTLFFLLLY